MAVENLEQKNSNRSGFWAGLAVLAVFLSVVTGMLLRQQERKEQETVREARFERLDYARDQLRELGPPPQDEAGRLAHVARIHYLQAEEQLGLERYDEALRLYKVVKDIDPRYPAIDDRIEEAERELRSAS